MIFALCHLISNGAGVIFSFLYEQTKTIKSNKGGSYEII
jgi:hypothetical protein